VCEKGVDVDPVVEEFERTVRYNEVSGRYKVGLLWKKEPPILIDNRNLARSMLVSLERRLEKNQSLKKGYEEALLEMEKDNHIVEIPSEEMKCENSVFYLPHHPHVRESSTSTKIRPVFNASARGSNGVSLNDCLECGPNLNPVVSELLCRFRRKKYAVSADIKKSFSPN